MTRRGLFILLAPAILGIAGVGLFVEAPKADPLRIAEAPSLSAPFGSSPYGHDMGRLLLYSICSAAAHAVWAASLSLLIATMIGFSAALTADRMVDRVQAIVSRLLDSIGILIFGMCILAVLPRIDPWMLGVLLALMAWPSLSTVIRTETLMTLQTGYIEAARAVGVGSVRLFGVHIFPAIWPRLRALFFGVLTGFIGVFAALSFVGAGSATQLTIGSLLFDSLSYLRTAPWYFAECFAALSLLLLVPGLVFQFSRRSIS